ncbi:MAG: FAD-dependent oxidoreductase [Chloroflexota bacterium]|nr:MAG: NADP oxidoreductase [Chloroflexota bacterium]
MTKSRPGTPANPLRVAIIGSGPSGFYAADFLQKQTDLTIQIDMYERLPTPYGLVRGGVAPDHQKIKSVTNVYEKIAVDENFRFYGNVEVGRDVMRADLLRHYHAIIYAIGTRTDRRMGIPGEDLPGSHAATEFVGWYNAHPDFRDCEFDLSQERVAVIGNGNVAMDVARILASTYEELATTDIADYALEALAKSRVREIYVLGRRGPAQAAFTNPEIRELGELREAEVIVRPEDVELDPLSAEALATSSDRTAERNVQVLMRYSTQGDLGKPRKIYMRFFVSPVEILGDERVEAIRVVKNKLVRAEDGSLRAVPTDEYETIPVGLVFRSIGYMGVALPDVPFDERRGIIPNIDGRVFDPQRMDTLVGEYVVGWIKRGPSGIIGTNKPDAQATVMRLLDDVRSGRLIDPEAPDRESVEQLLRERQPDLVTFDDWQLLDMAERERGQPLGRPRVKYSQVHEMLAVLTERKGHLNPSGD